MKEKDNYKLICFDETYLYINCFWNLCFSLTFSNFFRFREHSRCCLGHNIRVIFHRKFTVNECLENKFTKKPISNRILQVFTLCIIERKLKTHTAVPPEATKLPNNFLIIINFITSVFSFETLHEEVRVIGSVQTLRSFRGKHRRGKLQKFSSGAFEYARIRC